MNEELKDKTVISIIIGTILLIFLFIFTFLPSKNELSPPIQWKDSTLSTFKQFKI